MVTLVKCENNSWLYDISFFYINKAYEIELKKPINFNPMDIQMFLITSRKELFLKDDDFFYSLDNTLAYKLKEGKICKCDKKELVFKDTLFFSFNQKKSSLFEKLDITKIVKIVK